MQKSKHVLLALALPFMLLGTNVVLLHTDFGFGNSRENLFLSACFVLLPVVFVLGGFYVYVSKRKELIPALAVFSGSSVVSLLLQLHYICGWWSTYVCIGSNL